MATFSFSWACHVACVTSASGSAGQSSPVGRRMLSFFSILCVALGLIGAFQARAAEICVNSDAFLEAALDLSQLQQSAYTIKIVQGAYTLGEIHEVMSQPTRIEGGYTANCVSRSVNPANTTINFGGSVLTLDQTNSATSALISIDGVSIVNLAYFQLHSGTTHDFSANVPGDVRISRSRLSGKTGANLAFYVLADAGGSTEFENVMLDRLPTADTSHCGLVFLVGPVRLTGVTADLSNNTDLCFYLGISVVDIYDSIIWSSDGSLVSIHSQDPESTINIVNSLYRKTTGPAIMHITAPVHVDPQWVSPATGDYHLQVTSPAVNSGTVIVPAGLPATDIEGNSRWVGSKPDRGAYESPFNDASNYLVTTTADSGTGSLRDAITQANSLPNPGKISFAIPGACPRVIALASVLPKVTSPIVIDATTQAGASVNNSPDQFNATLCVLLKPASGTLTYGFAVSAGSDEASLALRGMGLGGFGQPVVLLGGANHVIAGTQFGGTVGGVALPGASLYAVTLGVSAEGSLIIGGAALADRNVIGAASFGGINLQSTLVSTPDKCQIVNNLIGLAPNAISSLPNFTGILAEGSGCSIVGNRVAANTNENLWISGGSDNVVQSNIFGVARNDSGFFGGAGVRISGNGSGNIIGSSPNSMGSLLLANTIRYNQGGGVIVESGTRNAIRANFIYENGSTGTALDIDLGDDGTTANDANDFDTGANQLQNFPIVDGLYYTATSPISAITSNIESAPTDVDLIVSGRLNSTSGNYRVDAYFSTSCNNGAFHVTGRGHAQAWLGSAPLTIPAGSLTGRFSMPVTLPTATNAIVSLTATDALGNTSEIGSCYSLANAVDDRIFVGQFEP